MLIEILIMNKYEMCIGAICIGLHILDFNMDSS